MYSMQRRFPKCKHNIKHLRTCKTEISEYPVLFSVDVPSLVELCAKKISSALNVDKIDRAYLGGHTFTNNILYIALHYLDDEQFVELVASKEGFLRSSDLCTLSELCLNRRNISGMMGDDIMSLLSSHRMDIVALSESDFTHTTLNKLAATQPQLTHLDVSYCLNIEIFDPIFSFKNITHLSLEKTNFTLTPISSQGFLGLQNLRWLNLSHLRKHGKYQDIGLRLERLITVTPELLGLDLACTKIVRQQHAYLLHFKKLEYLNISWRKGPSALHEPGIFKWDTMISETIPKMSSLKFLDISHIILDQQSNILKLKDLDLKFLGLRNDVHDIRIDVQDLDSIAQKVASHKSLEHILNLLTEYRDDVFTLEMGLKSLYTVHRARTEMGYSSAHIEPALFEAVLGTLERYPEGRELQHIAVVCLYTLNNRHEQARNQLSEEPYPGYDRNVRRAIILLIIAITIHTSEYNVLRYATAMLQQFCSNPKHKDYMLFEIIHCLLRVLNKQKAHLEGITILSLDDVNRETAKKICVLTVRALNNSICQTSRCKRELGRLKLIETVLDLSRLGFSMIRQAPHEPQAFSFIELLLETWSTLWNITDEQARNCDTFVSHGGLELYFETYEACSAMKTDDQYVAIKITTLVRNMLGLLGNIAEVPHIRPSLQDPELIRSFHTLRTYDRQHENECDIIEISYSAAGILSHICSDGKDKWICPDPELTYEVVLQGIEEAVHSWDLSAKRSINYKSFNPILHILRVDCPYPCKLWAVWALSNLCETKPKRYIPMLRRDGGVELLNQLRDQLDCPANVKRLSTLTVMKCYDPNIGSDIEES